MADKSEWHCTHGTERLEISLNKLLAVLVFPVALIAVASGQSAKNGCAPGYSDCILKADAFKVMPESLKDHSKDFAKRLETVAPITKTDDGWYFGEGCMAHKCGEDEAAWVVNEAGKSAAVIMRYVPANDAMPAHENFELYGDIPKPLAAWAIQHGMTEHNSIEVQ